jgi:hypothetical protein
MNPRERGLEKARLVAVLTSFAEWLSDVPFQREEAG